MADLATLQTRLSEAEAALHKLACGARSVSVSFGERTITYSTANVEDLRSYVKFLRAEIAAAASPSQSRVFTVQSNRGLFS